MQRYSFSERKENKDNFERLYLSAFPENERPPLFWTYEVFNKTKESEIYCYYDNDEFIGFTYLTYYLDYVFVLYLAVSKNKRNQGYGTEILKDIQEMNKKLNIILCFEEVDDKYSDNDNRIKRMNFYKKCGFILDTLKTQEADVIYQFAHIGNKGMSYPEYVIVFDLNFGKNAHKKYLKLIQE